MAGALGATGAAVDILVSTASPTAEAVDLHLDEPTIPNVAAGALLVNTTQVLPGCAADRHPDPRRQWS